MRSLRQKTLPLLLLATLAMAHANTEPKWDLRYEGIVEPTAEGAVEKTGGKSQTFQTPAKKNYQAGINDDGLEFFFKGAGVFALDLDEKQLSFAHSTIECRLRLEETRNLIEPPAPNASAVCIQVGESGSSDAGTYMVGFYTNPEDGKNYVILEGRTQTTPVEIGRDFHVFRVVARENGISLYVDGTHAGEVAPRKGVAQSGVRLGNARGSDHTGTAVLDYLRINLSESLDP